MASLIRTRILPRLAQVALVSRPALVRPMMATTKRTDASEQLEDILNNFVKQSEKMEELQEGIGELQEQVANLEEENARLRKKLGLNEGDYDDDDLNAPLSTGDRDTIEKKLDELDDKLDDAKNVVEEIRTLLQ